MTCFLKNMQGMVWFDLLVPFQVSEMAFLGMGLTMIQGSGWLPPLAPLFTVLPEITTDLLEIETVLSKLRTYSLSVISFI